MFRQFMAQVPEASWRPRGWMGGTSASGGGHAPLCRPVIAITAGFTFIFVWNGFLGPLIYLHSEEKATSPSR